MLRYDSPGRPISRPHWWYVGKVAEKSGRFFSICGEGKESKGVVKDCGGGEGVSKKWGVCGVIGVEHWVQSSRKLGVLTFRGRG